MTPCIYIYIYIYIRYILRVNFEAFKAYVYLLWLNFISYSAIADRNSIYLESTVNAREKKSALYFHGSKIISYCGHFVLCSEEIVNKWAGEGLENREVKT